MYKIVRKKELNPTVTLMDIEAPFIARKAKAGQFIIFRVDDMSERVPLTIAGYEARMITYVDMWGDYCAEVHVNFGEPISGNYCVDFSITSEKSMDACTSDIVMAIINTLTAS